MTVRSIIGVFRFVAATYMEIHRACLRWWAEEIDRAEAKR